MPQYWFNTGGNVWESCTNGGSFGGASLPVIFLGTSYANSSGSGNIVGVADEPFRLNPYRRVELYGNASTANSQVLTSGGTVVNGPQQYGSVIIIGSTTALVSSSGDTRDGLQVFSQNPILISAGKIASGGAVQVNGGSGSGGNGNQGGFCGAGGGGGGSTTNAGGAGLFPGT